MCDYCVNDEYGYKKPILDNGDDYICIDRNCDYLLNIYFMNELDRPVDTNIEIDNCPKCGRKLR